MQQFKIRASASGQIMTNPRSKSEKFSKTTLTFVEDWLKEQIYGFKKDFGSKYTEKGTLLEDEAIDKAIEWLDLPFVLKNELTLSDEHFTGTPDLILEDEVLDIKCSWNCFTFPLFDNEIPTKDYYYQLQVYMALTGKKKARLVYVLLNTPEEISPWETKHDYSALDKKYRIKTFNVEYDEEIIKDLRQRVEAIREYLLTIKL
jgi:hypothetical protein